MRGELSQRPAAELIHEISAKSLAGKLQLEHDRIKAVLYFDNGELLYAVSNLRSLRVREYLLKAGIAEGALARYDERQPDLQLVKALCADHVLSAERALQVQSKQTTDVVRLALSWAEGEWDFDPRARLDGAPIQGMDTRPLLLDAGRRTAPNVAAAWFGNPAELMSRFENPGSAIGFENPLDSASADQAPQTRESPSTATRASSSLLDNLLPGEGFILSRLDRPTPLKELLVVTGVGEKEMLVHLYSLALAGFVKREEWNYVLGGPAAKRASAPQPQPETPPAPPPVARVEEKPDEIADAQTFLDRLSKAQTHYDVLDVGRESTPAEMKIKYYDLARRYHPDRFRRADAKLLRGLESAFARVTQAYDTLRDDRLRASYDAKLLARQKAQQLAESAPKPTAPTASPTVAKTDTTTETKVSVAERAEQQFKEGYAALESGERKVALGLFASAANAVPNEPRYRAYYGRLLAQQDQTRRAAEAELQAAVKLDPKNGEYRVLLAELYRDLGFMLRARGEAERALAADPNSSKARELLRTLKSV